MLNYFKIKDKQILYIQKIGDVIKLNILIDLKKNIIYSLDIE